MNSENINSQNENNKRNVVREIIALHDNMPYVFNLMDVNYNFVDCNNTVVSFLVNSKEDYLVNRIKTIPLLEALKECSETGSYFHEFMMQKADGSLFPGYIILQNLKIKDQNFIASYIFAISEINSLQKKIESQNKLVIAINNISQLLLTSLEANVSETKMNKIMLEVLQILGDASRADRCYIWENYNTMVENEMAFTREIYKWTNDIGKINDTVQNTLLDETAFDYLSQGVINELVCDLPFYYKAIFEQQNVQSILIVPIHIGNKFWGFIGFDNCHSEELWEKFEEDILTSAGIKIAKIIDRYGKSHNIR